LLEEKKKRPRIEKACRGRRCGRLSNRTERQLGGGVLPFRKCPLGGGVRTLTLSKLCGRRCITSMSSIYIDSAQIVGSILQSSYALCA
jgi:hypothetical protein